MLESFKERFRGGVKEKRRERREYVEDGTVEINGQAYRVHDWSTRAFMAKPCDVDCKITDRIDIKFSIRLPTKRIEFVSRAIVVRLDRERQELAAYFAMLDEATQTTIADHFGDGSDAAMAPPPEPDPAAEQRLEARRAEERRKSQEAFKAQEAREAEEARKAEEARRAEAAREAEEARLAEERRKAEEAREAEEARKAEQRRKDGEAGRQRLQRRLDEEMRKHEDEAQLPEEKREAVEARRAVERRNAEAARVAEEKRDEERSTAEAARHAEEAPGAADPAEVDLDDLTAADAAMEQEVDGGEPIGDRTEAIKRRAAEIAAEIAAETAEIEEDMRSAIFDLGMQNLAAFRKKVDAAGITQILRETPRIKVYDHDHAYGFHLGKMEYAVFADWDSGTLCREVGLEEGTRRPRITDFDHDEALNEMVDCLARMLATIEAGGAL